MHSPIAFASLIALGSRVVNAWTPAVGDSWNYNLITPVKVNAEVDVVFIDMDYDDVTKTIRKLHRRDKAAVCYISIGSWENWRDDADDFPSSALGNDLADWEGEKWLDVTNSEVRAIMAARVDKAASLYCDGVEPDNMDVYTQEDSGVDVSEADQISYNTWFAGIVQEAGMKVGLKNTVELVEGLVDSFDFAINESCFVWDECDAYEDTFLAQGKPVFNVEYVDNVDMCDEANALGMDTIIKTKELSKHFCSCADPSRDAQCKRKVLTKN